MLIKSQLPPTGIFNLHEHLHCRYYDSNGKAAQVVTYSENFSKANPCTLIVYILSGTLSLSHGDTHDYILSEGDFMLFPPGEEISVKIEKSVTTLVLRINEHIKLCSEYALEKLHKGQIGEVSHTHLRGNRKIKAFVEEWAETIEHGVQCIRFSAIKTEELFFMLRLYYPEDELARFYFPMLGADAQFMNMIWKNYRAAHNTIELASMTNQSVSRLSKEFKRIIGISVGEWMVERKVQNVHYDLYHGDKSLKEIASEYHFASPSHLGAFCKKKYGKSPAALRLERGVIVDNTLRS
jgi:AraC-like DNA-binding protein